MPLRAAQSEWPAPLDTNALHAPRLRGEEAEVNPNQAESNQYVVVAVLELVAVPLIVDVPRQDAPERGEGEGGEESEHRSAPRAQRGAAA